MKFTDSLVEKLAPQQLLKHEFYQAWNSGSIPLETLRLYAKEYFHHVSAFPRYLSATHSNCANIEARQVLLDNLIDEEKGSENHPELWLRFAEGLGADRKAIQENTEYFQETRDLVDSFMSLSKKSYASGLGALFAYEHQIPEIASFKTDALKKHYSIDNPETLSFFEVHKQADAYHTEAVVQLMENLSEEEKIIAENSARITADRLWKFLDAIHRSMSV